MRSSLRSLLGGGVRSSAPFRYYYCTLTDAPAAGAATAAADDDHDDSGPTEQCLEILTMFAKALLGSLPDLVPPEVLPVFRRAVRGGGGEPDVRDEHAVRHVHHTESLLDNFVLNTTIAPETRQTAALCLLLTIPEVWAMNGSILPAKLVPLSSLNFKDASVVGGGGSISFVSAAAAAAAAAGTTIASTGGRGGTSAGTGAARSSSSPEFGPGAPGAGAPQGINRGRGWSVGGAEESREQQDLLRKQAEVCMYVWT